MVFPCIFSHLLGLQASVYVLEEQVRLGLGEDAAKELVSSVDGEEVDTWYLFDIKIANAPSRDTLVAKDPRIWKKLEVTNTSDSAEAYANAAKAFGINGVFCRGMGSNEDYWFVGSGHCRGGCPK